MWTPLGYQLGISWLVFKTFWVDTINLPAETADHFLVVSVVFLADDVDGHSSVHRVDVTTFLAAFRAEQQRHADITKAHTSHTLAPFSGPAPNSKTQRTDSTRFDYKETNRDTRWATIGTMDGRRFCTAKSLAHSAASAGKQRVAALQRWLRPWRFGPHRPFARENVDQAESILAVRSTGVPPLSP